MRQFEEPLDAFSACPLSPAVTCSVFALPEEPRKVGLVWEVTPGFFSAYSA